MVYVKLFVLLCQIAALIYGLKVLYDVHHEATCARVAIPQAGINECQDVFFKSVKPEVKP